MSSVMVELRDVTKVFAGFEAVRGISLAVGEGEFLTLLGPSGCGKTTTLRIIAGFESPTSGTVWIDGEAVTEAPPFLRQVNTVFQNYALFPHLTVFENVAFGLRVRRTPAAQVRRRVAEALQLVALESYGERRPFQLSGGQQQRVALARAIVNQPKVLLLDEPLGALDLKLRRQMQTELKHLQRRLGMTFIYVTHDQEEALSMSDRVAVMNSGLMEQVGTPAEIYERPASRFVAEFVGETNLLAGVVSGEGAAGLPLVAVAGRPVACAALPAGAATGSPVYLSLRPEAVRLRPAGAAEPAAGAAPGCGLPGRVADLVYTGAVLKVIVEADGGPRLIAYGKPGDGLSSGAPVYLEWDPAHVVVLRS